MDGAGLPLAKTHVALFGPGKDVDPSGVAYPGVCFMVSPQAEQQPTLRDLCCGKA